MVRRLLAIPHPYISRQQQHGEDILRTMDDSVVETSKDNIRLLFCDRGSPGWVCSIGGCDPQKWKFLVIIIITTRIFCYC